MGDDTSNTSWRLLYPTEQILVFNSKKITLKTSLLSNDICPSIKKKRMNFIFFNFNL